MGGVEPWYQRESTHLFGYTPHPQFTNTKINARAVLTSRGSGSQQLLQKMLIREKGKRQLHTVDQMFPQSNITPFIFPSVSAVTKAPLHSCHYLALVPQRLIEQSLHTGPHKGQQPAGTFLLWKSQVWVRNKVLIHVAELLPKEICCQLQNNLCGFVFFICIAIPIYINGSIFRGDYQQVPQTM